MNSIDRTDRSTSGISTRRALVKGATWAVPVLATAVAAPAVAASPVTCPSIDAPDQWTLSQNEYAVTGQTSIGPATVQGSTRDVITVQTENNTANNSGLDAEVRWTTQLDVVAGTTYTFDFFARGTYGSNNPAVSQASYSTLSVDGMTQATYTTRSEVYPGTQIPMDGSWAEQSISYTATATGTVPLEFLFVMPSREGTETSQDDHYYELPRITCS
ncbi:hypothetical protein [Brachybacterium sp. YJGR34]|uniref:hypothetical protein n=1 Tax=Brachybacterium sp. YJGR34 TaxID=2059911 RepID=UPI000E0C33DB|nr:hypothetical protein [Brachybacterium sp. YJGR34]